MASGTSRIYTVKFVNKDDEETISLVNRNGKLFFNDVLMECFDRDLSDLSEDEQIEYNDMISMGIKPQEAELYVRIDYPDDTGILGDGASFDIMDYIVVNSLVRPTFVLKYPLIIDYEAFTLKYGGKTVPLPSTGTAYREWQCDAILDELFSN